MIDVDAFRGLRGDVCRRRAVFDDIGKSANAPRACRRQFFLRNSCLFPVSAANDSRKNHPNQRDDEDRPQVHGQNMTCSCRSGVFLRMPCHLLEKSSVFLNKLLFGTMSSTFFASAITAGRRALPSYGTEKSPSTNDARFPFTFARHVPTCAVCCRNIPFLRTVIKEQTALLLPASAPCALLFGALPSCETAFMLTKHVPKAAFPSVKQTLARCCSALFRQFCHRNNLLIFP